MANENRSMVAIPATVTDQITSLLNQANAALEPYVTSLTNEERKTIFKMSDKSQAFVQKVDTYTDTNPQFVPSFLNVEDLKIDFNNNAAIAPVLKLAEQLYYNLNDTGMVAGSEAFKGSLMYYNNVKQADKNGISNARSIYEDLQKRFPGRPKNQNPDSGEENGLPDGE
jgi:hypothetical protein